jgi:uncharacterized membrane protein YagU involved in acid resistance
MNVNFLKAAIAGIVGTAVMTIVGIYLAPMMGIPRMNPAEMLAGQMGGSIVMGWAGHIMIGIVLAVAYAVIAKSLPGAPWLRGALFGVAPWLLAQLAVMPMMGMPLFSGSMAMAGGSLIGHLMYGATVGVVYGTPASALRSVHA